MMRSPFRLAVLPLATLLLGAAPVPVTMRAPGSDTPDDRRDATRRAGPVPLTILAVVGGKALDERGEGECKHAPIAAVYGVRSAMWVVQYDGGRDAEIRTLRLTMWHPLDGGAPDQVNVVLRTAASEYRIDTVNGSTKVGSGTISIRPRVSGGEFELAGRAADGTALRLRVLCPRFTPLEPIDG